MAMHDTGRIGDRSNDGVFTSTDDTYRSVLIRIIRTSRIDKSGEIRFLFYQISTQLQYIFFA